MNIFTSTPRPSLSSDEIEEAKRALENLQKATYRDRLPGGLADRHTPDDVDPDALEAGIKVELEHTDDRDLAREIALDHLIEDRHYYRKLRKIEKSRLVRVRPHHRSGVFVQGYQQTREDEPKPLLRQQTQSWLLAWADTLSGEEQIRRTMPSDDVIQDLRQFRPARPVRLYRGESGYENPLISMTYSKQTARAFSDRVTSVVVDPNDILVDFTKIPSSVLAAIPDNDMLQATHAIQEVIVFRRHAKSPAQSGSLELRPKSVPIYHSSPSAFAGGKPDFDAFFGSETFNREFPNEFGPHLVTLTLPPDVKILDLNGKSREARQFKSMMARRAFPDDRAWAEQLERGDAEAEEDFYDVWTDKTYALAVLKLTDYDGVKYQEEYLLPKKTIARLPVKRNGTQEAATHRKVSKSDDWTGYHGTTEGHIRSIMRQGLRRKRAGHVFGAMSSRGRSKPIYLAGSRRAAERWARYHVHVDAEHGQGHRPVVLAVRVPSRHRAKLDLDVPGESVESGSWKYTGNIPVSWITRLRKAMLLFKSNVRVKPHLRGQSFVSGYRQTRKDAKSDASDQPVYSLDVKDAHHGQIDGVIRATVGDSVVGHLDWNEFRGEAHIAMVEVDPAWRGHGIGLGLVERLRQEFPDARIAWGMTTPEGTKLRAAWERRHPPPAPALPAFITENELDLTNRGDLEEALAEAQESDWPAILAAIGAEQAKKGRDKLALWYTDMFVIDDTGRVREKRDWLADTDPTDYDIDIEADETTGFWDAPPPLYHATSEEHVQDILREGLVAQHKSRGVENRWISNAVFTADDPEWAGFDAYGDHVIRIDTEAMARDGVTPRVVREPGYVEAEGKRALAALVGMDDYVWESLDPLEPDPAVVILMGDVPAKYLSVEKARSTPRLRSEDPSTKLEDLLARVAEPDGGFTFNPYTGHGVEKGEEGYAVALYPGREKVIPAAKLTVEDLLDYTLRNGDLLKSDPKAHLGVWHDPETHTAFLDISGVVTDQNEAYVLGRENHQRAVFNFKTGHSEDVPADHKSEQSRENVYAKSQTVIYCSRSSQADHGGLDSCIQGRHGGPRADTGGSRTDPQEAGAGPARRASVAIILFKSRVRVRPYTRRGRAVSGYEQNRDDAAWTEEGHAPPTAEWGQQTSSAPPRATPQTNLPVISDAAYEGISMLAEQVLRRWEATHALEPNLESGMIVNTSGKILFNKKGERSTVPMSGAELALLRGAVFTHNHPGESPIEDIPVSLNDALCGLFHNAREIRAVTAYSVYRLRPGVKGWPPFDALEREYWRRLAGLKRVRVSRGAMFVPSAPLHEVWEHIQAQFSDYLEYERIPHSRLARLTPPLPEAQA